MARERKDLKRTRLDLKNPLHRRILHTRWKCENTSFTCSKYSSSIAWAQGITAITCFAFSKILNTIGSTGIEFFSCIKFFDDIWDVFESNWVFYDGCFISGYTEKATANTGSSQASPITSNTTRTKNIAPRSCDYL